MDGRAGNGPVRELERSLLSGGIVSSALIALTMFTAPFARADPTSAPGDAVEGVFGESTAGSGQPDSKTGAMGWTYPFNLPAARGRPQPGLTLTYNSFSHDREAGYGWGLDTPVIERQPLSGNPCFLADGTPVACGERRMASPNTLVTFRRKNSQGKPLAFVVAFGPNCQVERVRGWR